jgi:adenylate cyclase
VQDEITEAVTGAVAPAIADAERQRAMRKSPGSLDAWGAYQRGLWHYSKANVEENALAQKFFQQAIDLDPTFGGGYRGSSNTSRRCFQTRNVKEAQSSAEALARRAVALHDADPEAHACLIISRALQMRGDHEGAQAEAQRALAICPNLAGAHGMLGQVLIFAGRPKESLAALQSYFRLGPHDPLNPG